MFNLSGSEVVVILLLALVVLGPDKLPDALRRAGRTYAQIKKMGDTFQAEMRSALDEPMQEMRETADLLRTSADLSGSSPRPGAKAPTGPNRPRPPSSDATPAAAPAAAPEPATSPAQPSATTPAEAGRDGDGDERQALIRRTLSGDRSADAMRVADTADPQGPGGTPSAGDEEDAPAGEPGEAATA